MRAYRIEKFGGIDGLRRTEVPDPQPGPGQVVVHIRARALNYRDLLILKRLYPVPAPEGVVPLSDGAGEVVALGEGVSSVLTGDRVCGVYFPRWREGQMQPEMALEQFGCTRDGMLADYVTADEQALIRVPAHLSFEEAATLPCAGVTAWHALNGLRPILPGETVLTVGSGGVALFALQFACLFGAEVIAVTSNPEKAARLRKLGAHTVVDRCAVPDWEGAVRSATGGRGVDHVVETGALDSLPKSLAAAAPGAEVALVAALGRGTLDVSALRGPLSLRRLYVGSRGHFEAMNRAIELHKLRPVIDEVVGFDLAHEAYSRMEARRHVGKIVIGG